MNYRERFLQIKEFLKPYQKIWQNEIMLMYPDPLRDYPMEWVQDLARFQDKETVIRLEKKDVFPFIESESLRAFYTRIAELSELPQMETYPPMPEDPWTWLNMIPKKQHEIRKLAPHINKLYQELKIESLIDIGGGVGMLAQTLNQHYAHKVISVDMNSEFQRIGIERHQKNSKHPDNKVRYENMKVEDGGKFAELLKGRFMPIGLHTCGKLALDMIRAGSTQKVPGIVNFGCCYHTLDAAPDLQNLSEFAQKNDPIRFNKFALTLSCRAHKKMGEKDYDLKLKVKWYRYAIHILLHDHYGIPRMMTLGNSHKTLYDKPFSEYATEQFRRINVPLHQSKEELDNFYNDPALQKKIIDMLAAGLIRNALGRVMELYLLLDRAIFLEEQGYKVQVQEFFDEELSPRNIGITAVL